MIVSGEQRRNSATYILVSILPQTAFPSRLPHNIEQNSLCCTVGSYLVIHFKYSRVHMSIPSFVLSWVIQNFLPLRVVQSVSCFMLLSLCPVLFQFWIFLLSLNSLLFKGYFVIMCHFYVNLWPFLVCIKECSLVCISWNMIFVMLLRRRESLIWSLSPKRL